MTGPAATSAGSTAVGAAAEDEGHGWLRRSTARSALAWMLGGAGLLAYNWWLLVPLKPGLMRSPNELFSNLEVTGQPYATAMQHADLASGVLLAAAFLTAGRPATRIGRREWLAMLVFAVAGAVSGVFPEVCADSINAVCHRMEWSLQLPASQYVHMAAGVLEFAGITIALACAVIRTRHDHSRFATVYRRLAKAAVVAYPLLGAAYLGNRLGGVMEAVFFVGFTVMVVTQLAERTSSSQTEPPPGQVT